MDFMTIKDAAEKWEISKRRIQTLCSEGSIPGAERLGYCWAIPKDAGKLFTHFLKNADKLIVQVYQRNYDWREGFNGTP